MKPNTDARPGKAGQKKSLNRKLNDGTDASSVVCEPDKSEYKSTRESPEPQNLDASLGGDLSVDLLGAGSQFD
ncbi:hypothetical protein PG996_012047 [Apiospora saccharicola]|uniref:Uncharacterized protein n=1 Tax=Apiospora saccharicola TaxID=335842 RepID=A0ABR1U3L2_9PEZI